MTFFVLLIVILGATRMGKTFGVIDFLLNYPGKVICLDPQNSLSRTYLLHLMCRGLLNFKNVLYDQVTNTDRAPPILSIWESDAPSPLKRMQENALERSLVAEQFYGRRGIDATRNVRTADTMEDALKLIQFQDEYAPLYWLWHAVNPLLQDNFDNLIHHCTEQDTVARCEAIKHMSPAAMRNELGPVRRLVEPVCCDPAFIARCGTSDPDELIRRYDSIIVEGGGAADHTIEAVLQAWMYKAIQYVDRHHRGLCLAVDEAFNWNLVTKDTLRAVSTLEKYSLEIVILTQTLAAVPADIRIILLQNARRVETYRVGSSEDARLMSGVMGIPYFDPSESAMGQNKTLLHELMTMPRGTRYVRDCGKVFKEQSPRLQEPYPWEGISERMMKEVLEQMVLGSDYQTPKYYTPAERHNQT